MIASKDKILYYILKSFFHKDETTRRVAENINSVYGPDPVHRFRSGNFIVKGVPRCEKPIIEIIDKMVEIVEYVHLASTTAIAQELNIAQKSNSELFIKGWM